MDLTAPPGPLAALWPRMDAVALSSILVPAGRALGVPCADDRSVWDPVTGRVDRPTVADLARRAERDVGAAWPQALSHQYSRYFRDGNRDDYEQVVFARQRRLSRAAVMAASTLEPAWLDEVADGITLLCEQSTWCWPAHDDTRAATGAVVPAVTRPFLDLGAGEVAGQLAWIDHLLGTQLDAHVPGLRTRVRHEVRTRVLDPFTERRDWHWLGLDGDVHNWSPWISGNVLVAALRLLEDDDVRSTTVCLVIEGLDRYVAALPPDGAIDEGYGYWWNGACRALEALEILRGATDGVLDAAPVPSLRATVGFPHRMHLGGAWYLNVADGAARPSSDQPWHALHRAARRFGDPDAERHARAHRHPGAPVADEREGLGRLLRASTDDAWCRAAPSSPPLPRQSWLPSTQVLVARGSEGSASGLTLGVKGGHNGEHHNHNDIGSVVVALHGVPVVVDAGRPTYTAKTFGPDRYAIWTMQSSWHSVPEVRGTPQGTGHRFAAKDVHAEITDGGAGLLLELAGAYPRSDVRHWQRSVRLDRSLGSVVLTDTWQLDADPDAVASAVHLLLAGEVSLPDGPTGGVALVEALDGVGRLALRWDPAVAAASLEVRVLDDAMLADVWGDRLTRLRLDLGAASGGVLRVTAEEIR